MLDGPSQSTSYRAGRDGEEVPVAGHGWELATLAQMGFDRGRAALLALVLQNTLLVGCPCV